MTYIINLKKSAFETINSTPIYSFINEKDTFSTFIHGTHTSFHYYKEKTPHITEKEESIAIKKLSSYNEDELCITGASSSLVAYIYNLLNKNKNILYLNEKEAAYDIERTWRIIQEKRNLKEIKTLYIHLESWSKMAYAYRAATSYKLSVEDITY